MARPRKDRVDASFVAVAPERRELWEGVVGGLRAAILDGSIAPGTSLVEADLADRFAVSRGPIREALRELAREGLVADLPHRGTVVSTLTFADIREVYAIRDGLESVAARLAIELASDTDIRGIRDHVLRMEDAWDHESDYADSLAEDLAFHRGLVGLSNNGRLVAVYEQMLSQTQLLVRSAAAMNPSLRRAMRRSAHRDIHEALLARDADRARTAIADHYAYAEERLFAGLGAEA